MEPTLPTPKPEVLAVPQQETMSSPARPEVNPGVSKERRTQVAAASQPAPVAPTQVPPTTAQASQIKPATDGGASSDTPQIADDVDVIEKEWVDKAKKIVSSTKHDPHEQEKQVSRLQADYLMKRYNKQIKVTE